VGGFCGLLVWDAWSVPRYRERFSESLHIGLSHQQTRQRPAARCDALRGWTASGSSSGQAASLLA